jgi:uncharacterized Zn-binding protein involved in type VI secretion
MLGTRIVATIALGLVMLAGCGSTVKPAPPVRLTINSPSDGARTLAGDVSVSGTVSPASATVLIAGNPVAVTGGSFTTTVPVRPGFNVLDVLASSPQATDAMNAVRVYRQILITIPDLGGESPSQASAQLTALGLVPSVQEGGGFLEPLLPGSPQVCQTDPSAGRTLTPGSPVRLQVAKLC